MIGKVIANRYRIRARIGAGGAGEVYEAEDLELPRRVAIKFLAPGWGDDPRQRQRFLREAEALSVLDHPHICTIYKAGVTEDGRMFIAMAYYAGLDLRARVAGGALDFDEAVSCAIAIADGMRFAHRKGFLHRDLKPGNVVITDDGVVKILDFGLAKLPDRTQVTETGVAMGTLAYASPEQAMGQKVDARSDIYSLGVILYQMLTGQCPFAAPSAAATLRLVLNETPEPIARARPETPRELAELVDAMVAKEPDERPESMDTVHATLVHVFSTTAPERAARLEAGHMVHHPRRSARGRRLRWAALALLPVLLALPFLDDLQAWLGIGEQPGGTGLVVLPLRIPRAQQSQDEVGHGLWLDLVDRAQRIDDRSPSIWVAPAWVAERADRHRAPAQTGAGFVLSGSLGFEAEGLVASLEIVDASSSTEMASRSWTLGEGSVPLGQWIAETIGVDVGDVDSGYTESSEAYLDYLRGRSAQEARDAQGALDAYEEALRADPDFLLARLHRAAALSSLGQSPEEELESLTAEPAVAAEAHQLLAEMDGADGDPAAAVEHFRKAMAASPGSSRFLMALGGYYLGQGDYDRAETAFRRAMRKSPTEPWSYQYLAYLFTLQDRHDEVIEVASRILDIAPDNGLACNYLGAAWFNKGEWEQARISFEKSFQLGRNFEACTNLGVLYSMDGRYEEAARMHELALSYRPRNHRIIGNLASAVSRIGGRAAEADSLYREAILAAEESLAEDPQNARLIANLAGYYAVVDSARAMEFAAEALALDGQDSEVLYRVAMVYEDLGDRLQALSFLSDAVSAGYSVRALEREPELNALRNDSRYRLFVPQAGTEAPRKEQS